VKITLGICNGQTSSACIFLGGKLKFAVSEERFTRVKMDSSFPKNSINFLLKKMKLKSLKEIDKVSYSWSKGFDPNLSKLLTKRIKLEEKLNPRNKNIFFERLKWEINRDQKKRLEFFNWVKNKKLEKKLDTFYHHEAHALSATLPSTFSKAICITSDARGDFESTVVWQFNRRKKNPLKKLYSSLSNDSLGFFYARITGLLGFKPNRHEGKITGLAAYGNPKKTINLMSKMIDFNKYRIIANNGKFYKPFFGPYSNYLKSEIKKYKAEDIAAGAQKHLETIIKKLIKKHISKKKPSNLCLAGGVFSNTKLNEIVKNLKGVQKVFIQPQMNDGGLCIGAAAGSIHKLGKTVYPMTTCNLGYENSKKKINFLKKKNDLVEIYENKVNCLVKFLKKGFVVGFVKGPMEFGPRALLNRSIIFKTSDVSANLWLNKRLKRTEFMPFAPVTTTELAKKCFVNFDKKDTTFKFMTSTTKCTNLFKEKCPAVCHVDGTARPQVVSKSDDKFIHSLITKWEKNTGELSLINTSFNTHEEPIVRSYEDAINELKKKIIDVLILEKRIFVLN